MRKGHRWLSIFFGVFLLWVATTGPRAWVGFFHHLHSGEEFGPVGTAVSLTSGFALFFFAFSGLCMYIQMYRRRSHRHSHPRRLFW